MVSRKILSSGKKSGRKRRTSLMIEILLMFWTAFGILIYIMVKSFIDLVSSDMS